LRIVDIRETAVPLKSTLANSSIDFTEMTTSVVAVITDVVRVGKPVCGFAFNSTGRYACGAQMRARFIPRILKAPPDTLLDAAGHFAPDKCLAVMLRNEKSGGHSERSVGIGTIEVAVWDALAKILDKPLHVLLAERFNGGTVAKNVFCYVGGGWYAPGKTTRHLQDEMRGHLDAGYTMVKMKVGGMPLADDLARVEAVKSILPPDALLAVDANSKFERAEALAYAKGLAPFALRWFEEPCDPLDFALLADTAVDRRKPVLDARRGKPRALRRPQACALRRHPDRSAAGLRHRAIRPHARHAGAARLAAQRHVPARRQSDVARHRRRLRPRRRGVLSGRVWGFRRLCRRCAHRERQDRAVGPAWYRFRRPKRALPHHA
jgi:hypothetical protein